MLTIPSLPILYMLYLRPGRSSSLSITLMKPSPSMRWKGTEVKLKFLITGMVDVSTVNNGYHSTGPLASGRGKRPKFSALYLLCLGAYMITSLTLTCRYWVKLYHLDNSPPVSRITLWKTRIWSEMRGWSQLLILSHVQAIPYCFQVKDHHEKKWCTNQQDYQWYSKNHWKTSPHFFFFLWPHVSSTKFTSLFQKTQFQKYPWR